MLPSRRINALLFAPFALLFVVPTLSALILILIEATANQLSMTYVLREICNDNFWVSFRFSLYIAFVATLLCSVFGFLIALLLLKIPETSGLHRLLGWPILFPHFAVAFMVFLLFSQSGLISRFIAYFWQLPDPSDFPAMVFDQTGLGIILTYVWKEVPFAALMFYSHLLVLKKKYFNLSQLFCRSEAQFAYRVLIPLSKPMAASVFTLLFAYNFGAFEVPLLLGPTSPRTLSVLGFIQYQSADLTARPSAMAINLIITGFSCLILIAYMRALDALKAMGDTP